MGKYKNRVVLNQRGGSLTINNETDQENISISQRSGSNIRLTNVVNTELATNNKQTTVVNDEFKTVGNDSSEFVAKNRTTRTGEDSYELDGFVSDDEINAYNEWKESWKEIALLNAEFKIKRGGTSLPNGTTTEPEGSRKDNPVIGSKVFTVQNDFNGYTGIPIRYSNLDEVTIYAKVPDRGKTKPASEKDVKKEDVEASNAPAVAEFGADKSAATEGGEWQINQEAMEIDQKILDKTDELFPIEKRMGNGGDKIKFIKRNKFEQVGAAFNDFPSVRIDTKGRSQPIEMCVGKTGAFKQHDYVSLVEEVDNTSAFPGGDDTKYVGNRYVRNVGSGGISFKTTGVVEQSGTILKQGFKKVNINASHGIHIGSEDHIDIQSVKTITLRTNRQVYVESSLGVRNNLIVGGGLYVEGETYLHHVTAPLEVQQTEDTVVLGKFATETNRRLVIGECNVGGAWYPVYALANDNLILTYPHSHHFNNIPLRMMKSNEKLREKAQSENINKHNTIVQSLPQLHERKTAQ